MAAPSISTYILSNSSHYYGSEGGAAVMTSPSDSVTKVSAIISQTSGGAAIETVETTVKTSSDLYADRWALTWPTSGIASSPYYVRMWATNSDGDGAVREVAPYIFFPPSVSVTSPANGSTLTDSSVTMAWSASDDYGISYQRASVSHDGTELWGAEVEGNSIAVPSSIVFEDGESYSFSVMARNGKGMESTATNTASFSFVAPSVPALVIAEGDGKSASITVTDSSYTESGTVLEASSAMMESLTIHGKSVQDGTPTPSAPVAIKSVRSGNLSPFFSHDLTDIYNSSTNPNGYWFWFSTEATYTQKDDGWMHVAYSNTGGSAVYPNFIVQQVPTLKNGASYTFLVEIANATISGDVKFSPNGSSGSTVAYLNNVTAFSIANNSTYYKSTTAKSDFSGCNRFTRSYFNVPAGGSISLDLRISIYEGVYDGPYTPVGNILLNAGDPDGVYTTTPIPVTLRSLPDGTHDEWISGETEDTLIQRCKQVVFDGYETWTQNSVTPNNIRMVTTVSDLASVPNTDTSKLAMSSMLSPETAATAIGSDNANVIAAISNHRIFVSVPVATYPNVAAWTSALASTPMTVIYKLETPVTTTLPHVTLPYVDGSAWVDAEVTPNIEATFRPVDFPDQPAADSVDVVRVNADGSTWTVASNLTMGDTVTDPLPPLGVDAVYKAVGKTSAGGMSEKLFMHGIPSTGWVLNFGDAAQETVGFIYNPQATMTLAQGGESYHFADGGMGGGFPVFYPTTDRDASGTLAFDTVLYGDSDRLLDLCRRYPVAWLRDPFGHRWRAHVRPSVSHGVGQVWPVTIAWDAVRFEEV